MAGADTAPTSPVWWALGIGLVVTAIALVGLLLSDRGPTRDAGAMVPSVTGLPLAQARDVLTVAGFVVDLRGVVGERPGGLVLEQDPPGNSRIEVGSVVAISVTIAPPDTGPSLSPSPTRSPSAQSSPPAPAAPELSAAPEPAAAPAVGTEPAPIATPDSPVATAVPDRPWIAIVHSPDTREEAVELFDRRYAGTYPDGGVLFSSDFAQMAPGVWVVYLDRFTTREQAQAFCRDVFGPPSPGAVPACYTRTTG